MASPLRRSLLPAVAACLVLTACGEEGTSEDEAARPTVSVSEDGDDGHGSAEEPSDHAGHVMNEPGAVPADELSGVEVRAGEFALLDTAPPGHDTAAGSVWVAEGADGTTVTVRMTGLEAGEDYLLHLHDQKCAVDDGGDHFQFDPEGGEEPPNEIHLAFTAGDDGTGTATVTNDRLVGDAARSVVIHPASAMDNRVACADF